MDLLFSVKAIHFAWLGSDKGLKDENLKYVTNKSTLKKKKKYYSVKAVINKDLK